MKSINLNFYPFTIVSKFDINNKYIDKLTDREILEYLFKELSEERYDRIVLNETSIEFDKNVYSFDNIFFSPIGMGIKNARIWVNNENSVKKLIFKYHNSLSLVTTFFLIPLTIAVLESVIFGILIFAFFFLPFLFSEKLKKLSISSLLEKLIDEEFRKELNRRRL